jgi:hypothetical protein
MPTAGGTLFADLGPTSFVIEWPGKAILEAGVVEERKETGSSLTFFFLQNWPCYAIASGCTKRR